MRIVTVILELVVLALLVTYLFYRHRQREREHVDRLNLSEWSGNAIDVSSIKPALEEVRRTYAQPPVKAACFHRSLLALARRAVAHLAFFHEREQEQNKEKHPH